MSEAVELSHLSIEETSLLRLFRALAPEIRESVVGRLLSEALCLRGARIEPLGKAEWDEVEDHLWREFPFDWPGQSLVELDNLGDPGAWLRDGLGESWLHVLFTEADDENWAKQMALSYAEKLIADGFSMPSEFGDNPVHSEATEEDLALFEAEFGAFLLAWRERVLLAAEKNGATPQAPTAPGSVP